MRYVKQKTDFDCGPIAVINALKWAGYNATYNDVYLLREYCQTTKEDGTWPNHLRLALKRFKCLNSRMVYNADVKYMLKNLWREDRAYVVGHFCRKDPKDGHFSFWVDRTEKYVKIININEKVEKRYHINKLPKIEDIYEIRR